jgi:molecular chaperone GrpE
VSKSTPETPEESGEPGSSSVVDPVDQVFQSGDSPGFDPPGFDPPGFDPSGSFGDAAGEMANESEVEVPPPYLGGRDKSAADHGDTAGVDEFTLAQIQVATLTEDLQRLQAEYANYRKRVDRDRDLVQQNARFSALLPIVEVLDTIDRAREHGPLEDGLKTIADQLARAVESQGLEKFGEIGDEFDPTLHEALSHLGTSPEVSTVTCTVIAKAGYKMGDRVVRAAQVLVVDPQ